MSSIFDFTAWSLEKLAPPWKSAASIYLHIRDNPNDPDLPDEIRGPDHIRFAPGAFDGVIAHHVAGGDSEGADPVQPLASALEELLKKVTDQNLKNLYDAVIAEQMRPMADELQQRIADNLLESYGPRIAAVGRYFAIGADQREATKFGILLLGVAGSEADGKLLETLATHEEFTLYAAACLSRLVDDPEQSLWRIAQKVHGWGRIELVERLNGTSNPEIQAWMLREGFRNNIMDSYLAALCARTGNLHEALQQPSIDRPLLDGASGILDAFFGFGPGESIDEYEHAAETIQAYVRHVSRTGGLGLKHLITINTLKRFLEREDGWEERFANGWTRELKDNLQLQCERIVHQESWPAQIQAGLKSDDEAVFRAADAAARELGHETWEFHLERARRDPLHASWFELMRQTGASRIDQVLELAISSLPLDAIATGPANHLGLGPGFEAHGALDIILQDLPQFPGRGWPLVRTGLQSSVTRNRNMAVKALLAWPREQWPAEAYSLLQKASQHEPNEDLKKRMAEALKVN